MDMFVCATCLFAELLSLKLRCAIGFCHFSFQAFVLPFFRYLADDYSFLQNTF